MLKTLFGNANIERVLLFLFINGKCYGTQLGTLLGISLTPVQNALKRLEESGVVKSHFEGKTRVYEFDINSPLRWELESLLKKLYTLLPAEEKRRYCFLPQFSDTGKKRNPKKEIKHFWERLLKVQSLTLVAKTGEERKEGKAEVEAHLTSLSTLLFNERGEWFSPHANFSNSLRWTLDSKKALVTLEHLRRGASHPVFLFHLSPTRPGRLESVDAHLCGEDTYLGSVLWDLEKITFHWRIIGPKKNEKLLYRYK